MAQQRSRVGWKLKGDRNTEYFHARARERQRTNRIKSLKRENGGVATAQEDLEKEAIDFYQNLFTAVADTRPERVTDSIPGKVTEEVNQRLGAPVTEVEIENDLFMMHSSPRGPMVLLQVSILGTGTC